MSLSEAFDVQVHGGIKCNVFPNHAELPGLGKTSSSDQRQLRVFDWPSPTILLPAIDKAPLVNNYPVSTSPRLQTFDSLSSIT
jgi:hypothetical protein